MIADQSAFPASDLSEKERHAVDVGAVTHSLKCWPEFFEAILRGHKTHDLRRFDDRHFRVGDLIHLREFDPKTERYSGRELAAKITYITSPDFPCALSAQALDPAFCILSIKKL